MLSRQCKDFFFLAVLALVVVRVKVAQLFVSDPLGPSLARG